MAWSSRSRPAHEPLSNPRAKAPRIAGAAALRPRAHWLCGRPRQWRGRRSRARPDGDGGTRDPTWCVNECGGAPSMCAPRQFLCSMARLPRALPAAAFFRISGQRARGHRRCVAPPTAAGMELAWLEAAQRACAPRQISYGYMDSRNQKLWG
ncbi:hypothetical protein AX27061_4945 [Achromobacter xylosoxidans NBRC 15126 = ATCC 27061]|nr:hypothetical protein AX27061_4945 [Achromobacter xylosoxidans NBRC 15126 = ATCC 27061]